MNTDWKALCAELLEALENAIRVIYHEDGTKHISTADAVIAKADTALAQPEPAGPTDEELLQMAQWHNIADIRPDGTALYPWQGSQDMRTDVLSFARAVLQRWGRPAIAPIPVSERLPGKGDLDDQGTCWMWHPVNFHYCLCLPDPSVHTHWLPFHALPLPPSDHR